jgi:hypothetical protein
MNILTQRDWRENHIKVVYSLDGNKVEVKSTLSDLTYFTSKDKTIVSRFIDEPTKQLNKLYEVSFEAIQQEYQNFLTNFNKKDLVN